MKDKNKISKEELKDFFEDVKQTKKSNDIQIKNPTRKYTYRCPKCNKEIETRSEACPYCNYKGYIPMSLAETKRIKSILFIIILAIAIIILIIRKSL